MAPRRHTLLFTMGDPAGIGPEILARTLSLPSLRREARLAAVGDPDVIAFIYSDTGHCADDPMVWQRLWPRWIYAERRHLF